MATLKLTRTLRLSDPPMSGSDVHGCKRAVARLLGGQVWLNFLDTTVAVRSTFGEFWLPRLKQAQAQVGVPQTGVLGPATEAAFRKAKAFDAAADALLDVYAATHPVLIEPRQGFDSLVADLWHLYTVGRRAGLPDLGTFNATSRLPVSGEPSDHATSRLDGRIGEPACAFDLGFSRATRPKASVFFTAATLDPATHYVIMENRIWTRDEGLHAYTGGGHDTHVHTSGYRR